jgi:hypothetical protein
MHAGCSCECYNVKTRKPIWRLYTMSSVPPFPASYYLLAGFFRVSGRAGQCPGSGLGSQGGGSFVSV